MNNHIRDACKQYITQEVNPEYAIMINGPWGCGKTYFVDELQKEKWLKGTRDEKVVKISLYSVTKKEDISLNIFKECFKKPEGTVNQDRKEVSGWVKAIGSGLKGVVEDKLSIDTSTIMPYLVEDAIKSVGVIIADDLERSSMPIHEIMGYFYNYIIEQNIRIVFIGNEDEIKDEEGNLDGHYKKTKEKLIGETYTVQPEIEEAVRAFLSPERKVEIPIPVDRAVETCLKVVNTLQIHNLRTIWQGLVRVQRLINIVTECRAFKDIQYQETEYDEGDNSKEDYLDEILELYLVLYLQLANCQLSKDDESILTIDHKGKNIITDAIGVYRNERCSLKALKIREEIEDEEVDSNQKTYDKSTTRMFRRMPMGFVALQASDGEGDKIWFDYLFHSKIDKILLDKVIEEDSQWFTPKKEVKSNLYKLVSSSLEMEQDEFDDCYNATIEEFKKGKYTEIGEIIQGYSMCLTYREYGVREYHVGEIARLFDAVIANTDIKIESRGDYRHILTRSSMGYAYSTDMTVGEGRVFVDKLRKLINDKRKDISKEQFVSEFNTISDVASMLEWTNLLYINNFESVFGKYLFVHFGT